MKGSVTGLRALAVLSGLMVVGYLSALAWPSTSSARPTICRPSAPMLAARHHGGPTALLFGNSQLHDGNWSLGPWLAVNCAVQGMTAHEALPRVPALPDMPADTIILGFGAVEALRGGSVANPADFRSAMLSLIDALRQRWPNARYFLATPVLCTNDTTQHAASALGHQIAPIAAARNTEIFDVAAALEDACQASYDGVHFTPAAYDRLSQSLLRYLANS